MEGSLPGKSRQPGVLQEVCPGQGGSVKPGPLSRQQSKESREGLRALKGKARLRPLEARPSQLALGAHSFCWEFSGPVEAMVGGSP